MSVAAAGGSAIRQAIGSGALPGADPRAADDPRSFFPPLNTGEIYEFRRDTAARARRIDWFRSETVRDPSLPKAGTAANRGPHPSQPLRPPPTTRRNLTVPTISPPRIPAI